MRDEKRKTNAKEGKRRRRERIRQKSAPVVFCSSLFLSLSLSFSLSIESHEENESAYAIEGKVDSCFFSCVLLLHSLLSILLPLPWPNRLCHRIYLSIVLNRFFQDARGQFVTLTIFYVFPPHRWQALTIFLRAVRSCVQKRRGEKRQIRLVTIACANTVYLTPDWAAMQKIFTSTQAVQLRQEIIAQCTWSESYPSLKQILKRTANQLPLLVSLSDNPDGSTTADSNDQTIFFFERNVSKKLLLAPLQQRAEHFDHSPRHCTFVLTDAFKGESPLSHGEVSITSAFQDCSNSFSAVNAAPTSIPIFSN